MKHASFKAQKQWKLVGAVLTALAVSGVAEGIASAAPPPGASSQPWLLRFEPNRGQFGEGVRYFARAAGYSVALKDAGARLTLKRGDAEPVQLGIALVGARDVAPVGNEQLPGRYNYLFGRDQSSWQLDVPTYARAIYPDALPGVDMVYYANSRHELEYDLVLAPGTAARALGLRFEGVRGIRIDGRGRAVLTLSDGGELVQAAPVAYQQQGVERSYVAARYELRADGTLGFVVGTYDHHLPLVIDPALAYSTYFGGSGFETATATALDNSGNAYLVGSTAVGLFPTRNPVQPAYGGGSTDAFICKLNSEGTQLVYATFLGGSDADVANGVRVDSNGNPYIVGSTLSTDFPTASPLQALPGGGLDAFVTKLTPDGRNLVYSTYLGGSADDFANALALGPVGRAYVVGTTLSTNFPTVAPLQSTRAGTNDAFVSYLNQTGSALTFSTYFGGNGEDYANGIATDAAGAAYIAGATASTNLSVGAVVQPSYGGGLFDAFVAKLTPGGASVAYSTYVGGGGRDEGLAVTVDTTGAAHLVGYTQSSNFPTSFGAYQSARSGSSDAFVSKVNPGGSAFVYSTLLGGTGNDRALGVATDPQGTTFVAGYTDSTDFPNVSALQLQNNGGATDGVVARFNPLGALLYSTYYGGSGADRATAIGSNSVGEVSVVGNTTSANLATSPLAVYKIRPGSQDAFVLKFFATPDTPASPLVVLVALSLTLVGAALGVLRNKKSRNVAQF